MPSHFMPSRIACTDCSVERSRSVSSMRSTNLPPWRRAYAHEKSAVRAPPMCRKPVGLGAKRVLIVIPPIVRKSGTGSGFLAVRSPFDRKALRAPAQHAAGEIGDLVEAGLAEDHRCLRRARTGAADGDDGPAFRDFRDFFRQFS